MFFNHDESIFKKHHCCEMFVVDEIFLEGFSESTKN
jgi:hypothetical protein